MTCTFNCVYCERGRTFVKIKNPSEFRSEVCRERLIEELRKAMVRVGRRRLRSITFSGTGEPTLEPRLGEFIQTVRRESSIPVKVITNSSLLTRPEVRKRVSEADEVISKMNTVSDGIFWSMHEPADQHLSVERIVEGVGKLLDEEKTKVIIEVLFASGIPGGPMTNNTKEEGRRIARTLRQLGARKVQIHTVRRSPAHPMVRPASKEFLLWALREFRRELGGERVQLFT
ncbi:radical SAM protein [Candidatus Bathyarchaeota archaeon]|nr:radical SAM protein [Candidatus Bathyarchaeota archaeon]